MDLEHSCFNGYWQMSGDVGVDVVLQLSVCKFAIQAVHAYDPCNGKQACMVTHSHNISSSAMHWTQWLDIRHPENYHVQDFICNLQRGQITGMHVLVPSTRCCSLLQSANEILLYALPQVSFAI